MEIRNEAGIQKAGLTATLVSAVAASICCIGPIAAATLGITGLGALARYEPYRPYFAALTLVFLAGAFYLAYRKRPAEDCASGSLCATDGDRIRKLNRAVLWVVTVIALVVLTFPTWSAWIWG
jgi:mercuric ion transport protein